MRIVPEWYISESCWSQLVRRMPIPCVDTIVYKYDNVLLGWRTISPYRNVWALIGGRMRYGESFADTSIRNCQESGITIHQPRYVGLFPVKFPKGRHDLTICMAAKHRSGEPKPTHELSKYVWAGRSDLPKLRLIGANYLKMLRTWWKLEKP